MQCVFCDEIEKSDEGVELLNGRRLCSSCIHNVASIASTRGAIRWSWDKSWKAAFYLLPFFIFGLTNGQVFISGLSFLGLVVFVLWQFLRYAAFSYRRWLARRRWSAVESKVYDICSFWPNYPPDWKWRRNEVLKRDQRRCSNCGVAVGVSISSETFVQSLKDRLQRKPNLAYGYPSTRKSGVVIFHTHHIQKFRSGGDHRLENLTTLCEYCHSLQPGHQHLTSRRNDLWKNRDGSDF